MSGTRAILYITLLLLDSITVAMAIIPNCKSFWRNWRPSKVTNCLSDGASEGGDELEVLHRICPLFFTRRLVVMSPRNWGPANKHPPHALRWCGRRHSWLVKADLRMWEWESRVKEHELLMSGALMQQPWQRFWWEKEELRDSFADDGLHGLKWTTLLNCIAMNVIATADAPPLSYTPLARFLHLALPHFQKPSDRAHTNSSSATSFQLCSNIMPLFQ